MVQSENGNLAFDTERQYIGSVYAKALLGVAEKTDDESTVLEELASITEVLTKVPTLSATLSSPRISFEEKEALIDKAFQGGSKTVNHFLKVVCQHGRFDSLSVISRTAQKLYDEKVGRLEVTLITAEEAAPELLSKITDKLTSVMGKTVRVRTKIDDSIIGGMVVKVGDTVFDGSVANQLQQVKRAALDQVFQEIRESIDRFAVDA